MADKHVTKCDQLDIDWSDKAAVKRKLIWAKGAVTRACSAITKLTARTYIFSTPAACEEARAELNNAHQLCVSLHIRWGDLEAADGTTGADETTAISLATYDEKYYAALDELAAYIAEHSGNTSGASAAPTPETPSTGKINACKLLFPDQVSKSKSPEDFRMWIGAFRRFFDASGLAGHNLATQQGYFLQAVDADLRKVIEAKITPTMCIFGPGGCVELLEEEFRVLYPIFSRRLDFFQNNQDPGEDAADYLHRVTAAGDLADLESMNKEDLTAFKFIAGCSDKRLREKLFESKRKDLTAIKEIVGQHARQIKDEKSLSSQANRTIASVTRAPGGKRDGGGQRNTPRPQLPQELKGRCTSCGNSSHKSTECSVKKNAVICNHCKKPGHLARVCISALNLRVPRTGDVTKSAPKEEPPPYAAQATSKKPVNAISSGDWRHKRDDYSSDSGEEVWKRLPVHVRHATNKQFNFHAFADTGSATTLISKDLAQRENIRTTGQPQCTYINVSGDPVPTEGTAPLNLRPQHGGKHEANTTAVITPALKNEMIIGRKDLMKMNVIPKHFPEPIRVISERCFDKYTNMKNALINNNPSVLTDDLPPDSMGGCVMKIHLTPGEKTPFRISTARQIPLHWKEKAEKVIQRLIGERVITRQEDPTEWCAPGFFVIKKNGDLRLVVDFTELNKYVRRPVHTFPSTQEILSGLDPESRVFAKLDATQGYHQVPLEEESSKLTTFLLPSGRFRFLRAPMGLSCSSDEFCRRSDEVVAGLPGIRKLVDDILVQAPDLKILNERIQALITRCREHNFTLSRRKLEIGEEVEFAGQMVSRHGVRPNPSFLQGLRDFPAPKTITELRSFLGMVNQLTTYLPDMARYTGILQALLKKDVAYTWLHEHQEAFDKLRHDLITKLELNHFNTSWPTQLVTDASRLHGLGFVLLQAKDGITKVIQCGSRSLSPAERNYSTLELELTAIVWAIQKTRFFTRGIESFDVITDHRPLVGIFRKSLPQIDNLRITRLREKVLDYNFHVKWVAGKDNIIADALSRAPSPSSAGGTALPVNACVAAPDNTRKLISDSAKSCATYSSILQAFNEGRLLNNLPCDHPARRLRQVWDQLSVTSEGILIVNGHQIYMPAGARKHVLQMLHRGHCGYAKTLATARRLYYWPSMKADIRTLVESCEACQQMRPSKRLEPFIHTAASYPMEKISLDLFHVGNKNYLVTADRYSRYIWVDGLRITSTKAVTDALDRITRIFGIPRSCRTDGGPQFRGPFDQYCASQGIHHEVSSPYNPRSNGHAEAAVKAAKYLIIKTTPADFPTALAAWRNTARENKPSPNELLFGRQIRDRQPYVAREDDPKADMPRQHIPQHDISAFQQGSAVRIQDQNTKRWTITGTVTGASTSGRTLEILTDEGNLVRRNRRFVQLQCATHSG